MSGLFLSLDGVDGAGKSTQVQMLSQWFRQRGKQVLALRDPGGTPLGEALRDILLHRQEIPLSMTAEMLLYMASRAQLVSQIIRPALAADQVVIADRFLLANVVYQGWAGGENVDQIWSVGRIATGGLEPQLTCILDVPVELALQRINRGLDRLESRGAGYMQKVRDGYVQEAHNLGAKAEVIDASQAPAHIHARIIEAINARELT